MTPTQNAQVLLVMRARFEKQRALFQSLVTKENKLREALENLTKQSGQTGGADNEIVLHQAGAEIAWRKWSGQRRSAINQDLANVLVNKARAQKELSVAFGRYEAMKSISKDALSAKIREHEKRQAANALSDLILRTRKLN